MSMSQVSIQPLQSETTLFFQAEFVFNILILLSLAIFITLICKVGPYQSAKRIVLAALIPWASYVSVLRLILHF